MYLYIQGTIREHSGNFQAIFREQSGNIQGTFRHSQVTFREQEEIENIIKRSIREQDQKDKKDRFVPLSVHFGEHSVHFGEHTVHFREQLVHFTEHSVHFGEKSVHYREHSGYLVEVARVELEARVPLCPIEHLRGSSNHIITIRSGACRRCVEKHGLGIKITLKVTAGEER